MVTPYISGRADSGNVDRHTCRATRAIGVTCKQPASTTDVKKNEGRQHGRCSFCSTAKDKKIKKQTGNVASAQNGCARSTLSRQFK